MILQEDPSAIVIVYPLFIVIGPAVIAFVFDGIDTFSAIVFLFALNTP